MPLHLPSHCLISCPAAELHALHAPGTFRENAAPLGVAEASPLDFLQAGKCPTAQPLSLVRSPCGLPSRQTTCLRRSRHRPPQRRRGSGSGSKCRRLSCAVEGNHGGREPRNALKASLMNLNLVPNSERLSERQTTQSHGTKGYPGLPKTNAGPNARKRRGWMALALAHCSSI